MGEIINLTSRVWRLVADNRVFYLVESSKRCSAIKNTFAMQKSVSSDGTIHGRPGRRNIGETSTKHERNNLRACTPSNCRMWNIANPIKAD
jgi:hypothetical protein